jgi:uncharacterized protein
MADPVVHFELMGTDREALGAFYAELFGWHVENLTEPPYATIDTHAGEGINGGIGTVEGPTPQYVAVYAATEDIRATFDEAVSAGAEVLMPVTEVPGVVTLALLRDPQGNVFGMTGAGDNQGVGSGDGAAVTWFEILGPEPKALRDFYVDLFGWEEFHDATSESPEAGEYEYYQVHTGQGGIDGGIGSTPDGASHVTLYATVEDLARTLERAQGLGAKTLVQPVKMGPIEFAQFLDPQGNAFGLLKRS